MLSECETVGQWVALDDNARVCVVHTDALLDVQGNKIAGQDVLVWVVKDRAVKFVATCEDRLVELNVDAPCEVLQAGHDLPYSRFTTLYDYARHVQQTCIHRASTLLDHNEELASLVLLVDVGFGIEVEELQVHEEDEDLVLNDEQEDQEEEDQEEDREGSKNEQEQQEDQQEDHEGSKQEEQEDKQNTHTKPSELVAEKEASKKTKKNKTKKKNKKNKTKKTDKKKKKKKSIKKKDTQEAPSGFSPNDVTRIVVTAPDVVDYTVLAKCVFEEVKKMVEQLGVVEKTLVRDPADASPWIGFDEASARLDSIRDCIQEDAIARALEETCKLQNQLWHADRTLVVKKFVELPNWINNERIAGLACHSVAITEDWQVVAPHQAGIVMASIHRFIGKLEDASKDLSEGKKIYVDIRHFFRPVEEDSDELVPAGMLYKVRGFFMHDFCVKFWGDQEDQEEEEKEDQEEQEEDEEEEDQEEDQEEKN